MSHIVSSMAESQMEEVLPLVSLTTMGLVLDDYNLMCDW